MDKNLVVKKATDEELAACVADGSSVGFEELISRYGPRLSGFLRPRISSEQDVEDLVQETFLKVYRNIKRFDPERKFSTWLYTAAYRLAISHFRSKKGIRVSEPAVDPSPGPQEDLIRKQRSENIWFLAKSLKPREYQALWLRYAEDLSIKEIAKIMEKTPLATRVMLHRARLRLAERILPRDGEGEAEASLSTGRKFSYL